MATIAGFGVHFLHTNPLEDQQMRELNGDYDKW